MLLYVAWSNAILAIHRVRLAQMKTSRLMGSKVKDWLLFRQNLKIYSKFTYGIFKLQGECDIKNTAPTMVHASVFYNLRILPPNREHPPAGGMCWTALCRWVMEPSPFSNISNKIGMYLWWLSTKIFCWSEIQYCHQYKSYFNKILHVKILS